MAPLNTEPTASQHSGEGRAPETTRAAVGRQRLINWGTLLMATSLVAWPAFGELDDDSFPLSNYPMFAAERGQPVMTQIVGFDHAGQVQRLSPELLGSSEVLQAKALVERAANGGAKSRKTFCDSVARRVHDAQLDTPVNGRIVRLELAKARFDPVTYFTVAAEPLERVTLHGCTVEP